MAIHYEMADPNDRWNWEGFWCLHLDLLLTRRKIFHIITDPSGETVFKSRQVSDCIAYLLSNDVSEYRLLCAPDRTGRGPLLTLKLKD